MELLLRAPVPADRARMLELAHDPAQLAPGSPVVVPVPATEADLDDRVAASAAAHDAGQPGDLVVASVEEPGVFLGSVSWRYAAPPAMRIADLGYAVHPDARGRGVARGGVRLLVRWLVLDPDGPRNARVQLDHSVENAASCRVALSAGFEREGVRRGFLPMRDADAPDGVRRHDVCLHGVTAGDVAAWTG